MVGVLVHEWIEEIGGSENVLEAMAQAFPDAEIRCLWNNAPERFPERTVRESWLAHTPLRRSKALAVPLMPLAWRRVPGRYDWALISSHAFAAQARFPQSTHVRKFVYVHTPARYVWDPQLDGRGAHPAYALVAAPLRQIDRRAVASTHAFAANSSFVRERIQRAWRRDSVVIYPPVASAAIGAATDADLGAVDRSALESLPSDFVLGVSRFVPYKRMDLVIAAGEAADLPVVLAGSGPEEERLREQAAAASVPVTFVIRPSDDLLRATLRRATALVFPAVEDFGILPVEAMASGTPVVGPSTGGVSESVVGGTTGAFVQDWTSAAELRDAVRRAADCDSDACRTRSLEFDDAVFADRIRRWVAASSPEV